MHASLLRPLFTVLLAVAPAAALAASGGFLLDGLTSPELREQIDAGKTTILVPIGGTEQNGPHMALGKHNARALLLAEKIAARLGNALVAPVIAYVPEGSVNPPGAHMRYPGTITVPSAAFVQMLESAARSFRLHGFRDVIFLGDHGGYLKELANAADRLNREWAATATRAHAVAAYYRVTETTYRDALKDRGFREAEIGTHAGLADTSLTLALVPQLVRSDRLQTSAGKPGNGVSGDPARSTAELGQLGVNAIVDETVAAIRMATRR